MFTNDVVFAIPDNIVLNCQAIHIVRIDDLLIAWSELIVRHPDFCQRSILNTFTIQQTFNGNDITSASEITLDKCIITDLNMVCTCSLDDFIVRNVCADLLP